ncbi:MAG: B12-binding domain-containing radical SAM protein, partial [Mycobacterium sp.]
MIAELEAMRKQRIQIAFIVDDNLIGTIAVKKLLSDVAAWQAAKGYPLTFVCYASLNLAEDDEMLELMDAANIAMVFIGIESPNEESLHETKKYQNVRKSATIVDRVRKVQDSGLEVLCGMIVGFDHDDTRIFKAHYEFIRQTDIMHPTVNM